MNRDPDNFPKPLDFIPERWVKLCNDGIWEERGEGDACDETAGVPPANQSAFVGFSSGGRNCVGKNIALVEGKIVLALMLREFKMEDLPGYDLDPRAISLTWDPQGSIPMILKRCNVENTNLA